MKKIRVFVVDDSFVARSMLIRLLSGEEDIEVVGEAGTGQGCIIMLDEVLPDVIMLEALIGGGMNVIDVIKEIKANKPDVRIVLCADPHAVDKVKPALEMGIADFVRKPYNKIAVLRAIRQV